jgi:hypothetical protein
MNLANYNTGIIHQLVTKGRTVDNQKTMIHRFSVNFTFLSIAIVALTVCLGLGAAINLRPHLKFLPFTTEFPGVKAYPMVGLPHFRLCVDHHKSAVFRLRRTQKHPFHQ